MEAGQHGKRPEYREPHGEQCGQQYGQPYGQQYGQQYGAIHGQQYGQPFGQQHGRIPHTTVTTQPGVIVPQPRTTPPNNHMALAIVSCLCCFWPTGIVAIICSSQSTELASSGDYEGAASKGRISFGFSLASILIGVIAVIIVLILYFTGVFTYNYDGN